MTVVGGNDSKKVESFPARRDLHVWRARPFFPAAGVGDAPGGSLASYERLRRTEPPAAVEGNREFKGLLLALLGDDAPRTHRGAARDESGERSEVAADLRNWRRRGGSGHHTEDLRVLHLAALAIGDSTWRPEIAHVLLQTTLQLTEARWAWLTTLDGDAWCLEANHSLDPVASRRAHLLGALPICRAAARKNQPLRTADLGNDHRWPQDPDARSLTAAERFSSVLAIPVGPPSRDGRWVLAVASRGTISLGSGLTAILNALATHAVRAMAAADSFETYRDDLDRPGHGTRALWSEHRDGKLIANAETELLAAAAAGKPLARLAELLAQRLEAQVLITDDERNLLANVERGGTESSVAEREELLPPLFAVAPGGVVHAESLGAWLTASPPACERPLKLAIRPQSPTGAASDYRALMPRVASVLALASLTDRLYLKVYQRNEQEILSGLIGSSRDAEDERRRRCAERGLDLDAPIGVLAALVGRGVDILGTVKVATAALKPFESLVGYEDGTIVALTRAEEAPAAAAALHQNLCSLRPGGATTATSVSIGGAGVAAAYRCATQCIQLMLGLDLGGTIATETSLQPFAMLLDGVGREQIPEYIDSRIGPLIDHDERRGTEISRTLLAYLDSGHSTSATSASLHIHPNTLRQRLERVDVLMPDWRDPNNALQVHLALRLAALRDQLESGGALTA